MAMKDPYAEPKKKGKAGEILSNTVFLVGCLVVLVAAIVAVLMFPQWVAGAVLIVVVAIAVLAFLAVVASIVVSILAVPVYLAKGEYMDDLDYDIDDVKDSKRQ